MYGVGSVSCYSDVADVCCLWVEGVGDPLTVFCGVDEVCRRLVEYGGASDDHGELRVLFGGDPRDAFCVGGFVWCGQAVDGYFAGWFSVSYVHYFAGCY